MKTAETFIAMLRKDRESRQGPSVYASDRVFSLLDAYDDAVAWAPHSYSPSAMHMGDCNVCGNGADAPQHSGYAATKVQPENDHEA